MANIGNEIIARQKLLDDILDILPVNIKFFNAEGNESDFRSYINNILNATAVNSEIPIFSNEDLLYIYNRFNDADSRKKLGVMFNVDNEIYDLFKSLIEDPTTKDNFKSTILKISNNLMKLQLNVLLSVCKQYSNDTSMLKLINLIDQKLDALNNVYINKPESENFKNAMNIVNSQIQQPPSSQFGGNKDKDSKYYKKYLKYKTKYMLHKKTLI